MTTAANTCPECGEDNPAGREHCFACGASLVEQAPPGQPQAQPPPTTQSKGSRAGCLGSIIGLVLVVAVAVAFTGLFEGGMEWAFRKPPVEESIPFPSLGSICDDDSCNGDTQERPAEGMVMVYVPGGEFEMGSTRAAADGRPPHAVLLDGFWFDRTEVTNAQYRLCVEAGACEVPITCEYGEQAYGDAAKTQYPVVCVDWYRAQAYCEWAGVRLPTEAEWEYAARGPGGYEYTWGNSAPDCDKANYLGLEVDAEGGCVGYPAAVGSPSAGASWCGALNMAGNVAEWVADWYGDYFSEQEVNPMGPASGEYRVIRGGRWGSPPHRLKGYSRSKESPDYRDSSSGFRCAGGSQ
jgi:formylglycine-generating enzyme required for sulfatase activity